MSFGLFLLIWFGTGFIPMFFLAISSHLDGDDITIKDFVLCCLFALAGIITLTAVGVFVLDKYGNKTLIKGRRK